MTIVDIRTRTLLPIFLLTIAGLMMSAGCDCGGDDDDSGSVTTVPDDDDDVNAGDDDDDASTDDDDDDIDDDTDDDDDDPVVVTDTSQLVIQPFTQAGVPGESAVFTATIYNVDGDVFEDVAAEWTVDNTALASVAAGALSSPPVELLDYGKVIVTATYTGISPEGNPVVLESYAFLYIQPDVLVLDAESKVGTLDTSNGDVVQNRFAGNVLDPFARDFIVAGHQLVVLADTVDQNYYYISDMDPEASTVLLEIGIGETNAPANIGYASNNWIWITFPDQDVVRVYDITETEQLGSVYFTNNSAPTSINTDNENGLIYVSQEFGPDEGVYGNGRITVFNAFSSLAMLQVDLPCKRPVGGYLDIKMSSADFFAVCNGAGGDMPTVEIYRDVSYTSSLTLEGSVGGFARVGSILYVGNRQAGEIFAIDLVDGSFTRGPGDPIELPTGSSVMAMHYAADKDRLFIGDNLDQVHAYDPSEDDFTDVYQFTDYEIVDITSW